MRALPVLSALTLAACTGTPTVTPPAPDPVPAPMPADAEAAASYTVSFPDAASQYLHVEAVVPSPGETLDLSMVAWTPGSYLIRDYARHVEGVTATTVEGAALPIEKVDKDTWRVTDGEATAVVIRYRVYAHTMSVRNNWVEPDFAVLNGAATWMLPDGGTGPYDVRLKPRDAWPHVSTPLEAHPAGDEHRFRAADVDTLLDSPILLGDLARDTWTVTDPADPKREVEHALVHVGDASRWDREVTARDVAQLTRAQAAFWGGVPYPEYVFMNAIVEAGGGLEHKNGTLLMTGRWTTAKRADRLRWYGLVSHELFHAWNVKRMRPAELGPFDYTREVHTKSLWIAEGLTSYYDDLLLVRAGLMDEDEYLERISANLEGTMAKPGRFERSLEDASFDAWIKYYRADENHDNVSVSYYTKGAVVGWMLDAEIRDRSNGWASLDDAMRLAYSRHSGETGYTPEQFQEACEEVAGAELDAFFDAYVRGTDELDPSTALRVFGLRLKQDEKPGPKEEDVPEEPPAGWLGADVDDGPHALVRRVVRDSPAWKANLLAGDEIIAVARYRLGSATALLEHFRPDETVTFTVSRRGRLLEVPVTLGEAPDLERFAVEVDPQAIIEAKDTRSRWLATSAPPLDTE